ncbi:MAG: bifunctional phosphopantothenoylcysteine decarboxylase/phosphopantothenate--cysteine ligase CoaBC [Paracoccaceae bacterium]
MLKGKKILLIIGGGIAAFKCHDLIRKLRDKGAHVTPVLTEAGKEFVTPLSISVLSSSKVYTELFDFDDEIQMGHIELSRASDVVLVVPATANLLAKMAGGMADDLATTLLLATDKKVFVAPAMNVKMWEHSATKRNIGILEQDDIQFIGPSEGEMACGEYGFGRMAEPEQIMSELAQQFKSQKLSGCHFIVTAGPTYESIDPVRFIGNHSSGKQGMAITEALLAQGAKVTLIAGPVNIQPPAGALVKNIVSGAEMFESVKSSLPADGLVMAAAVGDWRAENIKKEKIKKHNTQTLDLSLIRNADILLRISKQKKDRPKLIIGFAAETNDLIENASKKLEEKGCDWIVANDIRPETGIMGGTENAVTLISRNGSENWPRMSKNKVAQRLVGLIAEEFGR